MYTQKEKYNGKMVSILYPEEGYMLQHKENKLCFGSVSLEDGRKKSDYIEIEEPKDESIVD